jgi:hypothetical protein
MNESDLLNESIADAKAVRETALANAKTFLEENFHASMKEMFAEKLKEEMAEDSEVEAEGTIEEKLSSSGIGGEKGNVVSKQHPKTPSTAAHKNTTPAGKQEFDVKLEEEASVEEGDQVTSEELDEILAELENEIVNEEKEESEESEESDSDEVKESVEDVEESVNLDELLAELEAEGADVAQAPVAPAPAPAPEAPVAPAPAPAPEAPVAPVVGQVPSPSEVEEVTVDELAEALVAINEENESLKSKLSDYVKTVKYLKGVLNEANLLNAKLLYTNKLFKGKSLTESQKHKIINTFDLTKNIREVKLAYTVLAESFNAGGSVVKKKSNATAQTITEGLASKPVSSTKPESAIVEPQAAEMASRFKKLAGIKK